MSSTKSQKEKNTVGSTPRLTPRPTAASAARAAKYSTNRNVNIHQPSERPSPTRSQTSSSSFKVRSPPLRNTPKVDTPKVDMNPEAKAVPLSDPEHNLDNFVVLSKQESDTYLTNNTSTVIIEESSEERINCDRADNVEAVMCDGNRSRPYSPVVNSRPASPRNALSRPNTPHVSSRPHTPHVTSRPVTPAHPAQRCTTPIHQVQTPPRIQTPNKQLNSPACGRGQFSSLPRTPKSRPHSPVKIEDMKSAYNEKQKQYNLMKKELDLKQQAVLETFDCLRGMQERMRREGVSGSGEGFQEQELVVFNVADWSTQEIAQLCRDAASSSCADGAVELINTTKPIDESTLSELDAKIVDVPDRFANLCLQAMKGRQEIIDWVKTLVEVNDDGSGESIQRVGRYNEEGQELCELLKKLKNEANDSVLTALQLSKRAFRERNALIAVGESLVREIARLRQDIKTPDVIVTEVPTDSEVKQQLEALRQELDVEKETNAALKEKLSSTESLLRNARARITKMDRQLREADSSIASLTGTVKSLEDQSRQKEVQLEARARKLKESLKTGEITSGQLAQQRDALQAEISDLKEQIEVMTNQDKSTIAKINNELKDCERALEEQEKLTHNELKIKEEIAAQLEESQFIIEELKEKNTKLENSLPNPDLPTEREMDLWAELQAIKESLRTAEEEITICKREKVRFLETLTNITGSDNKVGLQQKLAAELMSKEEIMGNMQVQIRELTKSIKLNEQKVIQYEQYVHDLHAHNKALDCNQDNVNGINYQELQKDVISLKMNLLEAVHRNEELSEILINKDQKIEQQEKTSRAQARVLKVREELITMLKNNETEHSRELTALQKDLEQRIELVDEVNRQIEAKAGEIKELFATLENKQQQIHRLEKIVLSLDEQQRRAQAQRTKHEEKIAALQHELDSANKRCRRFLFF